MNVGITGIAEVQATSILLNLQIRWPDLQRTYLDEAQTGLLEHLDVILVGGASQPLLEQVQRIRADWDGVLFALSTQPSDRELVAVLDEGADEYLPVIVPGPQLVARVSAALRRTRPSISADKWIKYDALRVNPESFEAFLVDRRLRLTPTEFQVLYHLTKNGGSVITQRALQELVWGSEGSFYAGSLRKYIHRLRSKLRSDVDSSLRIMTEPRIGYRLAVGSANLDAG